uniref:Dynein light chain n=1 Tax=Schistosoma mansoni TaxID=6183 RepID=A0A146MG93_SCHMA
MSMYKINNSVIKNADMTHEMQKRALSIGIDSVRKYELEKDIADHLKKSLIKNMVQHGIV